MKSNKKKHIVLDLDETLIYSLSVTTTKKPDFEIRIGNDTYFVHKRPELDIFLKPDFEIKIEKNTYFVYKRPGLDTFLNEIFKRAASVSVWTAATRDYCNKIVKNIFTPEQIKKLRFIWSRSKTVSKHGYSYLKDMSKVFKKYNNMNKKNTILLDDNVYHFMTSPDTVHNIKSWDKPAHRNDRELAKVLKTI